MEQHTPATSPGDHSRPKLLLVDDHPANLRALAAILAGVDADLVEAASGEEALRQVLDHSFAAILLDVRMPDLDGFKTAELIRTHERSSRTPIIFLTADENSDQMTNAYALGAIDYLVKPVVPVILRAKVRALLDLLADKDRAQRQAEQFRLLISSSVDYAIFMLDPKGYIVTWNTGAQRIKGYSEADIVGKHFSQFYTEDALARGWPDEELRRAEADGRFEDEGWRVRKDGSRFWANVVITALRDDQGNLRGFSKVTRDLSERKRIEEALRRSHDELEAKVIERTRELTLANQQLAETSRRKDDFLAMLAHELRNPLAPVLNGLHILAVSEIDQHMLDRTRAMMERQIKHLKRLVDDLLDVSRITTGKIQVRRERVDLSHLVRIITEDRRTVVEQAGMKLTLHVSAEPVSIAGDPSRLAQVVNNLIDNAVKFRNGGDTVTVRLSVDDGRQQAVLQVHDKGIGIDPELFPRLFDAFSQGDRTLVRSRGGLGLGLSVVKGLVELHGGTVEASSGGPGHGASFTIRLPMTNAQSAVSSAPATTRAPTGSAAEPLRVLIVEDQEDAADSLRTVLQLLGHRVAVAYSGPEGLQAARDFRPDVVLCDIGLPGMDGYSVADSLRRDPATAKASLIAVSGYGREEDQRRARQAGFDHHLTKPVDPADLKSLLVRPA